MRILNQSHTLESVENLKLHPKNPRRGNIPAIQESIEVNGFYGALVVQKSTGFVLAGNHRLEAARRAGAKEVPVVWVECSDEEANRILLADNRTNDLAAYDEGQLADLLVHLAGSGRILGTGYDKKALDELLLKLGRGPQGLSDPDHIPDPPKTPVTRPGDLWTLGEHRLLCGDCTDPGNVQEIMRGELAILFATDPPYLVDYDGTNHPHRWNDSLNIRSRKNKDWSDTYGITWDESSKGPAFYAQFVHQAVEHAILKNAAWYCWHASKRQQMVESLWQHYGAFVHQQIIWVKDRPVLNRSWYLWQHEPCFFGWVRPNKPPRYSQEHPSTVWQIPTIKPGTETKHPTSKPVEVFRIPMKEHTRPGDLCYEPFAGSGSQLIAAEELSRRCFALEISPAYCDVIVERWEAFSGKKATRDHAGKAA